MVPIFLAAILEFLTYRLLELAGNETQQRGTQMSITPELLDLEVYSNMQLSDVFQFITISQVAPAHHQLLASAASWLYLMLATGLL
jgi:histone H2A